jgi:hypothetical protein
MTNPSLKIEIESLPISLQKEVADFVAFLKMKIREKLNLENLDTLREKFNLLKTLMNH